MERTGENDITHMQRSVLYQQRGYIAAALVQRGLDNRTFGAAFGVGLQIQHLCLQQHFLQQLIYACSFLRRDLLALVFAAPVLYEDVHVAQLLTDLVGVGTRFIYFVDCEHHGHTGSLRVVDGFDRLRHDGVVCGNDDDGYIRHLRSTRTHGGERRVTRSIQERDMLAVLQLDVVGTDMLGYSSSLTGYHVRVADVVEQRSLTVIDVTHDGDDRAAGLDVLVVDNLVGIDLLYHMRCHILGLETELFCHQIDRLGVQTLVDRYEQTETHAGTDNFIYRHIHHYCQVIGGNELGQFEDLGLLLSLHYFELVTFAFLFAAFAFMLGGRTLALGL